MKRFHRLLWVLLALSWLGVGWILSERNAREASNRTVELVMDLPAITDQARLAGKPLATVQSELAAQGIRSYAVAEWKLADLQSQGLAVAYEGLPLRLAFPQLSDSDPRKTYLVFVDPQAARDVQEGLAASLGPDRVRVWGADRAGLPGIILEVDSDLRSLQSLGLGFSRSTVEALSKAGYGVWLRVENKPRSTGEAVSSIFAMLATLPGIQGVIFGGGPNEALGYPTGLDETAAQMRRLGWKLGLIEISAAAQQKGIESLVRALPEQTVRVFALSPAHQDKLSPTRVIQMYSLAARERNLRVLYLRPYAGDPAPDMTAEQASQAVLEGVVEELKGRLGSASTFPVQGPLPAAGLGLIALGAAAATCLLLDLTLACPLPLGILILLTLPGLTVVTCFAGPGHIWRSLMALGTGCAVSTLALVSHFSMIDAVGNRSGRTQVAAGALALVLRVTLLSLTGALMATSFLSTTTYMLSLDTFRGVKFLTLAVPVLVVLLWWLRGGGPRRLLDPLNTPLRLYHVVGIGALGLLAIVYTLRSGNMSGDVGGDALEYEKLLRGLLDQTLGVRPRFKEFLVAHPALMLCPVFVWLGWRRWVWLPLLAGSIGQAGLVDTFAHVHTPLQVSLLRTGLGLLLGAIWGSLLVMVVTTFRFGRRAERPSQQAFIDSDGDAPV